VRCAADEQDAASILTAALTGLRRGELLALRWRDVDFPGQAIRVRGLRFVQGAASAGCGRAPASASSGGAARHGQSARR
jgi:hypothetical protein